MHAAQRHRLVEQPFLRGPRTHSCLRPGCRDRTARVDGDLVQERVGATGADADFNAGGGLVLAGGVLDRARSAGADTYERPRRRRAEQRGDINGHQHDEGGQQRQCAEEGEPGGGEAAGHGGGGSGGWGGRLML